MKTFIIVYAMLALAFFFFNYADFLLSIKKEHGVEALSENSFDDVNMLVLTICSIFFPIAIVLNAISILIKKPGRKQK